MPIISNKPSGPKNKPGLKRDSFLEAFKDIGQNDDTSYNPEQFNQLGELEKRYRQQVRQSEIFRKQEQILFTRRERETQQQVQVLQEEIKKLAKATGELAHEAEVAAMEVSVNNVGKYHINFFEKLIKAIQALTKQLNESSFWLASWNKKAQKRNYYWGQFKKSGSKFLLSADRYMATQAG